MEPMGPEALLVMARTRTNSGVAEYARLEYPRANHLAVEAAVRRELKYLPVKRSAAERLVRWGRAWFHHDEVREPLLASVRAKTLEGTREGVVFSRSGASASLAAVPGLQGRARIEREPPAISAVPLFGRA